MNRCFIEDVSKLNKCAVSKNNKDPKFTVTILNILPIKLFSLLGVKSKHKMLEI